MPIPTVIANKRRRISSTAADMQTTINRPGAIRINVTGAHIIDHLDDGSDSPSGSTPPNEGGSPSSSTPAHPSDIPEQTFHHHKRDIRLPNHTSVVSHVAADIGGSLAKVVYFSRENGQATSGGRLNFLSFETDKIDDCIEYLRFLQSKHCAAESKANSHENAQQTELCVMATGGGAYKFYDRIKERLGVDVVREDEMECLIQGLDFFITKIPMEVFTYDDVDLDNAVQYQEAMRDPTAVYPYLLVNIGSGVSMIKVSGPQRYQRIGGTSLGGGTLWGILSLLTGARTFDEMLAMAEEGDNAAVDLLVGDIYGEGMGYEKIGLSERTIASSFGKVLKKKREAERRAEDGAGGALDDIPQSNGNDAEDGMDLDETDRRHHQQHRHPGDVRGKAANGTTHANGNNGRMFNPADISRSLLYAISNNIGQISYLQSEKHGLQRIYFGGSFIRGHLQTIHTLSFAIKFWSKGSKQAYFLRHEGYLGAVGAFLKREPRLGERGDDVAVRD